MGTSFGVDAARYDRVRPNYPPALAHSVLAGLPGRQMLDVGIGTRLSSRPFRAASGQIVGVDADPRMAQFARTCGYDVEVARFEEWEPGEAQFDAVARSSATRGPRTVRSSLDRILGRP